jgi:membrane-bound lytic murein transglycosylase D
MERYLSRSTRYAPIMKEILRKEGLPEDLIYIALIESGFSSTAHSTASAVGYWQFIRGTGKQYRLRIDSFVDERRDFERSTVAAADYFKGLYNLFGAWYLAIASYNVGENRVKGLVMRNKTRDFWKLARERRLPQETVDYVPKFLAARLIGKEPAKYGFTDVEYMPPLEFSTVSFASPIDIRRLATEMGLRVRRSSRFEPGLQAWRGSNA